MTYECWKLEDIPEPNSERVEGYLDGFGGEPQPGANRSSAYVHGWWCGASDKGFVPVQPWQRAIADQIVALHRQSVDQEAPST